MMEHAAWWSLLLATDAPALPRPWAMELAMTLGWALVLALAGALVGCRLALPARRLLAAGLGLWTLLPGAWSPDYWLGLAFHAPSLSAMLLCGVLLHHRLAAAAAPALPAAAAQTLFSGSAALVPGLVLLLGYVLLLDTFAVLPLQVYAWGFSPGLLLVLLALSLLPWVRGAGSWRSQGPSLWLAPLCLVLFAATRLPTGNLWDAVLDPWLWLIGQLLWARHLLRRASQS